VVATSSPNPLGPFGIYPGNNGEQQSGLGGAKLVRFVVTQDKLQMIDMRELSDVPSPYRTPAAINAWPITNVDLKYRINLDGEKTNFYEENQELDWQVRQWVKINFAKNDVSDMAPLGPTTVDLLNKCTQVSDASATLVPDSFVVDEEKEYMQWTVSITLPLVWDDPTCVEQYGSAGDTARRLGRDSVTFNMMYSLARPDKLTDPKTPYVAMEVGEKDPIRHKYGPIEYTTIVRDNNTGMLQARELVTRFNPNRTDITWYFAEGFPEAYKTFFTDPDTGIAAQTNALMQASGAPARVSFKNFDDVPQGERPRVLGDVRYNMLAWLSDRDTQDLFAGSTQGVTDPRTGETLSASIVFNDFAIKDFYVQRIDAYLHGFSATNEINASGEWPDLGACKDGQTMPMDSVITNVLDDQKQPTGGPGTTQLRHDASSLFSKMQQYLQKPVSNYGHLGVKAFIAPQDDQFYRAYYALMPFYVFADPDMNQFVIREGGSGVLGPESSSNLWKMMQDEAEFHRTAALIDQGQDPYDDVTGTKGSANAVSFLNRFRELTKNHKQLEYTKAFLQGGFRRDDPASFSFDEIMLRDARHCVLNDPKNPQGGTHWESKDEWTNNLISTYWQQVAWHEFGHALGLMHNFMASVDEPNFPHYKDSNNVDHVGLYASSIMEYNAAPDRVFAKGGWAPYDKGAISWIYANAAGPVAATPGQNQKVGISGQVSKDGPWKDPMGWNGDSEIQFLYCSHQHLKYTPFCRMGDAGATPSEIIANQIDAYEWQYQWRNFRTYRKIWDNSKYVDGPAGLMADLRKFMSLWAFDWGSTEITDTLRRIGITNPDKNGSDQDYYNQLTNKFNKEASMANQISGAFHKALIQQATGERPYRTIYDKYYGDVTQQGIILDKLLAMKGWVALWNTDNYDQNQAGVYISSYTGFGDSAYQTIAEDAVESMVGGQYDVYPYFKPLAVAQFAQDTHNPNFLTNFNNRKEVLDWIGGWVFYRETDFLAFFRSIAVQYSAQDPNFPDTFAGCDKVDTCTYDPQPHRRDDTTAGLDVHHSDLFNEFIGPDSRRYSWAFVPDRNTWVVVDRDRHTATYQIIRTYNQDIVNQQDDGAFPGGAYSFELQLKYFLDYYKQYNDYQSN